MPSPESGVNADVEAIRTLAFVGPSGAGKTTLTEALLHMAGAIATPGSLERGNTVSDFDPLERQMLHSLNSAVMHLEHLGTRIHLIDTPGGPDFLGQSLPALEAVETAVIVINASVGIEPMAVRMMAYAATRHLDRVIVVNRIDAAPERLPALLQQIRETFGNECLPLNLPGRGGAEVVDCFFGRDGQSDFGSVAEAHQALVEQVVDVDAAFVERYLQDGDVDPTELHAPLEQALREGHLIPVCFTSARTGAGVSALLDLIVKLFPNPAEGNPPDFLNGEGAAAMSMHTVPDPAAHVVGHVFKVTVDPYVGKMGILRVHQGTVAKDSLLFVGDGRRPFKVGHLFRLQGKEHIEVAHAVPGDIVAVAKVDDIHFDAVLHDAAEDQHLHLLPLDFPTPVHGLAIEPRRHGEEQRLWEILAKLVDEDPCLRIERPDSSHETVVVGLGELHLRVLLERLQNVYRFEVNTRPPRVAYRETISMPAAGHHRHKKQSGGAGQFDEVFLRVEPLPRGGGFEFVDEVKGGAIPTSLIPAVEKGVREVLAQGAVAGYPVVDVKVVVYDGKHHSVDSKEVAFVVAGRKAFVDAILKAQPQVLEPVVTLDISAPEHAMGDIAGDLSSKRGMVTGTLQDVDGTIRIRALAPLSELTGYSSRLNALTAGAGRFNTEFSHYEAVPVSVQAQLVQSHAVSHDD